MSHFDIEGKQQELKELEEITMQEGFWTNNDKKDSILSKIKSNKKICTEYIQLKTELDNIEELSELVMQEFDEEIKKEVLKTTAKLEKEVEKLELQTMLSGKFDSNNAILTIHPGAGRNRITRLGRNVV